MVFGELKPKITWAIAITIITLIFNAGMTMQHITEVSKQVLKIEALQIEKRLTTLETSYIDIQKSLDRIESKIK